MPKLLNSFYVFRSLCAVVEAVNAIHINERTLTAIYNHLSAYWCAQTVTYEDDCICTILV